MSLRYYTVFAIFFLAILSHTRGNVDNPLLQKRFKPSSPFSSALETLQKQIGYTFQSISLLRRAMTHASFSEENNRVLSILGANVIEASTSLRYLNKDIEISAEDLNQWIVEISKVETCVVDGLRLGLQKVVRVSPRTNSSAPAVVCGAFRAIFGAIAVDTGKIDDAGSLFWATHGGKALVS